MALPLPLLLLQAILHSSNSFTIPITNESTDTRTEDHVQNITSWKNAEVISNNESMLNEKEEDNVKVVVKGVFKEIEI